MGYAVAAAVAIPVAFFDRYLTLRARPAFRRWAWMLWVGRIAVESGTSMLALLLAKQLHVDHTNEWYGWIAAGLVGPSLAKSHFIQALRGQQEAAYGLTSLYNQIRGVFDGQIDIVSARRQTSWLNLTVLPALENQDIAVEDLADRLEDYVRGLSVLSQAEQDEELAWIKSTVQEGQTDKNLRKALVRRAARLRAWGLLKDLVGE